METDGPYSHPAALDADVAGLDIPFADPGVGPALEAFGAEVVGLESHLRSIIEMGWDSGIDVFFGKQMGVHLKLSGLLNSKGQSVKFHSMLQGLDTGLPEVYNSTSGLVRQGYFVASRLVVAVPCSKIQAQEV